MATIFSKIIAGELPGRFVWRDDRVVAFLTIEPLTPGHTLIVPIAEVDHWLELPDDLADHVMRVARAVGRGIERAFDCERVALIIAGFEVPHVHIHVSGANSMSDLDFSRVARDTPPAVLDAAADALRGALRQLGHSEASE